MINMKGKVELKNIECSEFCYLDLATNVIEFRKTSKTKGFTGLYYHNEDLFFAIFPSNNGPLIYYKGHVYKINPSLKIECVELENGGIFKIYDYGLVIKYRQSKYLGFDMWSGKEDIDIFYRIANAYKTQEFYEWYTRKDESDI